MSASDLYLRDVPDRVTYLKLVKVQLSSDQATSQLVFSEIDKWVRQQRLADRHYTYALIRRLATLLRSKPRLVYGLNSLLEPRYRLECSTTVTEIRFLVLAEGTTAQILSTQTRDPPFPTSDYDLREAIMSNHGWNLLLSRNLDKEWLACLAQLLQEILDDPSTPTGCRIRAVKCLNHLASDAIIPPSAFVNLVLTDGKPPSDYSAHAQHMGGGGFTDIYMKVLKGTPTCFRVMRMFQFSEEKSMDLYKDFCSEITLWRQLKHPNILPFAGASLEFFQRHYCFVLPWLQHGSIMSYLKKNPNHDRFISLCEIVDAIDYLHGLDPPVLHKDIKGANILMGNDLGCLLADFGLSCMVDSQRCRSYSIKGSFNWMAPEVIDPRRAPGDDGTAADVYSLACTIYEIYTGQPPFSGHRDAAVMCSVMYNERPILPPGGRWTDEECDLWDLIVGRCWQANPRERPTIKVVKQALEDIRRCKPRRQRGIRPSMPLAGINTADLDKVLDWLEQELSPSITRSIVINTNTSNLPIHGPVPKVQATLQSRGLFTPNTPSLPLLPDVEPSTASIMQNTSISPRSPNPPLARQVASLPTPVSSPFAHSSPTPLSETARKYTHYPVDDTTPPTTPPPAGPLQFRAARMQPRRVPLGSRPFARNIGMPSPVPPYLRPGRVEAIQRSTCQASSPLRQHIVLPQTRRADDHLADDEK